MIDLKHTKQYTLSIRLSTDGFCFAAHNPQVDEQFAYMPYKIDPQKSLTANLKSAVQETKMLRHIYATVNIIVGDTDYTLIPKEFYDSSCERDLYTQTFPQTSPNMAIQHNIVGNEQIVTLFGIDHQLYKYISEQYPKAHLYTPVSSLINFGVEKSLISSKRYCLLYLHKRNLDFLCFENGTPVFANSFSNRDTADTLYYLLNCWQMLGLSQTDDTLHIAGSARNAKALSQELEQFIQHIHHVRPAEEFHTTELARIDEMPFDLQALIACE